jgi:hypothetical protein
MKRRLLVALGIVAAGASLLLLALGSASTGHASQHRGSARYAGTSPLLAFVQRVNVGGAKPRQRSVPCSIEGSRCVVGCAVPVATKPSGTDGCQGAANSRPCLEPVAGKLPTFCSGKTAPPAEVLRRFRNRSRRH